MKQLLLTLLFCFSTGLMFGQSASSEIPLMMPYGQNQAWASTLKSLDKGDQWSMISERFFEFGAVGKTSENEELYIPFLIIDGIVPHVETLSMNTRYKVRDIIRDDGIKEILVVDKEPEAWYANKVFTGIVSISLNNRKTSNKLLKLLTR